MIITVASSSSSNSHHKLLRDRDLILGILILPRYTLNKQGTIPSLHPHRMEVIMVHPLLLLMAPLLPHHTTILRNRMNRSIIPPQALHPRVPTRHTTNCPPLSAMNTSM